MVKHLLFDILFFHVYVYAMLFMYLHILVVMYILICKPFSILNKLKCVTQIGDRSIIVIYIFRHDFLSHAVSALPNEYLYMLSGRTISPGSRVRVGKRSVSDCNNNRNLAKQNISIVNLYPSYPKYTPSTIRVLSLF